MNWKSLFCRKESEPQPQPAPPTWRGYDRSRWKDDPELVEFAAALFRDHRFHRVMEVLWAHQPIAPLSRETDARMQLGRIQGYREALAVLQDLAVPPPPPVAEVQPDYTGDPFSVVETER